MRLFPLKSSLLVTQRSLPLVHHTRKIFTTTCPPYQDQPQHPLCSPRKTEAAEATEAPAHHNSNAHKIFENLRDVLTAFIIPQSSWIAPKSDHSEPGETKMDPASILVGHRLGLERLTRILTEKTKSDREINQTASIVVQNLRTGFIQDNNDTRNARAADANNPSNFLQGNDDIPEREERLGEALKGKKCLITGASRGIGAEIAKRFASEGASCILVGRNLELLEKVRNGLSVVGEVEHKFLVGDVGSEEFWRGLRREKNIDILVNAAGLTHYSPLFVTSPSLLEEVIKTNLMGTVMGCRTVGKSMMASRNSGCIINVASLLGMKGGRGSTAYAASKAGVIGLTRALAAEIGEKGIRVNVIVPGFIETDMTDSMTPEARSEALNAIPLKRFGQSSEIADAAMFLATNKYANNCVLNLDGGLSAV